MKKSFHEQCEYDFKTTAGMFKQDGTLTDLPIDMGPGGKAKLLVMHQGHKSLNLT
jgi:hypothetical protein